MSPVIDERVVQMEFDNSRFEKNVSTSISTLDKLKSALRLDGASKGLTSVENTFRNFNLASISSAVENISSKFTLLGMIGVTALQRIATQAVNTGERLLKAMTVDQLSEGWKKYADKTTAIQTIMSATTETWQRDADSMVRSEALIEAGMIDSKKASEFARAYGEVESGMKSADAAAEELGMTVSEYRGMVEKYGASLGTDMTYAGSQMEYVNQQMEKLNWFTDETSYNFTDMVNNIGKFTANNIPLSQATTAMQGIATWAAISGQNAGTASRAMYNMAQAIGVGSVKLMDWKSIENANMATADFKKHAMDAAVAVGTLTQGTDGLYKTTKGTQVTVENFSQTLSEGWFNKSVLLDTLNAYGGFTDALYQVSEASGLTATDLLGLVEAQKKGTLTQGMINEVAAEGSMSAETLAAKVKELAGSEYDLGREAFRAAQEAKTFEDAIEATKDAASTKWMNIFENIFGDYERARHVWTDFAEFLYNTLVTPLEKIEELSQGLKSPFEGFTKSMKKTQDASKNTADDILELVHAQREGTLTQEQLNEVAEKGALNAEDLGARVEKLASDSYGELVDGVYELADKSGLAADEVYNLVKAQQDGSLTTEQLAAAAEKSGMSVEELSEHITELGDESNKSGLDRIVEGVSGIAKLLLNGGNGDDLFQRGIFGSLKEGFERVVPPIELTKETITKLINRFRDWSNSLKLTGAQMSALRKAGEGFGHVFEYISNSVKNLWEVTKPLRDSLVNLASAITSLVLSVFASGRDVDTAGESFETLSDVIEKVAETINTWAEKLRDNKEIIQTITDALSGLWNVLKYIGTTVANFIGDVWPLVEAFVNLGTAIGGIILGLFGMGNDLDEGGAKSKAFKDTIQKVADVVNRFADSISNLNLDGLKSVFSVLSSLAGFISGVFDVIVSLLTGSELNIDPESGLGKAITWIQTKFGELKEFLSNLDIGAVLKKAFGVGITGGIFAGLIALIKKVTDPFKSFTEIGDKIGGIFDNIGSAIKTFESKVKVDGLLKIAEALALLAVAFLVLGLVNYDKAIVGVLLIAGVLAGLYEAMKATDGIDKAKLATLAASMLLAAAAMLVMAVALGVLAGALALFALVAKMDTIGQGLGIMIIVLFAMVAALEILSKMSPKVLIAAAALLILSAAMLVLAAALAAFAAVAKMDTIAEGLLYMAATLAVAVAGLMVLATAGPMILLAAASLLIVSVSILVLAGALAAFAAIAGMDGAWTGVALLVTILAALTIALLALSAAGPMVIVAAAALLVVAAACLVLAAAVGVVGLALPLLALGLASLGAAIGSALSSIGQGAQDFLVSLSDALVAIGDALAEIITSIGTALGDAVSSLGEGIAGAITDIIASVGEGIGQGITAISDAIGTFGENLTQAGLGVEAFGNGVRSLEGIKWTSTAMGVGEMALALNKLNVTDLATNLTTASETVTSTCTDMVAAVQGVFSQMESAGQQMIVHLVNGFKSQESTASVAAGLLANNVATSLRGGYSNWVSAGNYLGEGFEAGIRSRLGAVQAAAAELAAAAAEALAAAAQIASPSKVTTRLGGFWGDGFINGVASRFGAVENVTNDFTGKAMNSLNRAQSLISNMLEDDFTPTITPVLDLSNVEDWEQNFHDLDVRAGTATVSSISAQKPGATIQNGNETTANRTENSYTNTINIYATPNQDVNEIADAVERRMVLKQKQRTVAFAR